MNAAIREAIRIVVAGCLLALLYTGLSGKAIFQPGAFDPPQPLSGTEENAPEFIEYGEAFTLFTEDSALFVDSRHDFDYEIGHIPRAINIPLKELEEKRSLLSHIPKHQLLVTYCDGQECNSSLDLAMKLSAEGFTNVKIYFGGWTEWQKYGNPVEKGVE